MSDEQKGDARCDARSGLVSVRSDESVPDAVETLRRVFASRSIRVFATIDHAAEARASGMTMPPTVVMIVGDPRAGTPMMLAAPTIAIDLPLKVLVAEGDDGAVWISCVAPERMQARHGLPAAQAHPLEALAALIAGVAGERGQGR